MWSPQFEPEQLNLDYAGSDLGDAFQRFVAEALRIGDSRAHTFRTLGQDGAIDVAIARHATLEVFEAKHTRRRDYLDAAKNAARDVADKLERNLAHGRTTSGHYEPWRNSNYKIVKYALCFSCEFASLAETQQVRRIVSDSLERLANAHLSHLRGMEVTILDWADFQAILNSTPQLALRWFEPPLPLGIERFEKAPQRAKGFHAYLHGEKLDYFSPEEYGKVYDREGCPPSRDDLLQQLVDTDEIGFVVVGKGGVGKTRLCEEVGKRALDNGWAVVRVTRRLPANELHAKRAFFTSRSRYLLVFDYIEDQRDSFRDVLDLLSEWRRNSCDIRFIANCRRSFERTLQTMGHQFGCIHLTEEMRSATYTEWVVGRILQRLEPQDHERASVVAKGLPVLAVFIVYVKERFAAADLDRLLTESEFTRWIVSRMPSSLGAADVQRELALLAVLLPARDAAYAQVYPRFGLLLDRLVADGWITESSGDRWSTWGFVHDVFADQVLSDYLRHIGPHTIFFVRSALDHAQECDVIESAIRAFERVATEASVKTLSWATIFRERLSADHGNVWRAIRSRMVGSQLVSWPNLDALVNPEGGAWSGAETDQSLQNALGRRLAEREREDKLKTVRTENSLSRLIRNCLREDRPSLLLIAPALKFIPEDAASAALRVARDRTYSLQRKNHVFAALLEGGIPFATIEIEVCQWLGDHSHRSFAARLLTACCSSTETAAREVARVHLPKWLGRHGMTIGASHLLRAALTPPKDKDRRKWVSLVDESYTLMWLTHFKDERVSRFVIEPWLHTWRRDALKFEKTIEVILWWVVKFRGDPDLKRVLGPWLWEIGYDGIVYVRDIVFEWLEQYHTKEDAQFVLSAWLKAVAGRGDTSGGESIRRFVEGWLDSNGVSDGVTFVLPRWLEAMGPQGVELARKHLLPWLFARRWPLKTVDEKLNVAYCMTKWLKVSGSDGALAVREPITNWFKHHSRERQTRGYILPGWLNAVREPAGNANQHELAQVAREVVGQCLERLGFSKDRSFLIREWLKAAGPTGYQVVEAQAIDWLERYGNDYEACFVLPGMLECGGHAAFTQINRWIAVWLDTHAATADAGYIYRGAVLGGVKDAFGNQIAEWIGQYRHYVDVDPEKENRIRSLVTELELLLASGL